MNNHDLLTSPFWKIIGLMFLMILCLRSCSVEISRKHLLKLSIIFFCWTSPTWKLENSRKKTAGTELYKSSQWWVFKMRQTSKNFVRLSHKNVLLAGFFSHLVNFGVSFDVSRFLVLFSISAYSFILSSNIVLCVRKYYIP